MDELSEKSWIWLVDLQKICSVVIGHSLGGLFYGKPFTKDENLSGYWLTNEIFSSGIDNENVEIEALGELSYLLISESHQLREVTIDKLPSHLQRVCRLALNIPSKFEEACAIPEEYSTEKNIFFEKLMDSAEVECWELEDEKELLDRVIRCVLTTLLKHTGMLQKSPIDPAVKEIFKIVLNYRHKLINKVCNSACKDGELNKKVTDVFDNMHDEATLNDQHIEDFKFKDVTQDIIYRCLFVLIFVKGRLWVIIVFYHLKYT